MSPSVHIRITRPQRRVFLYIAMTSRDSPDDPLPSTSYGDNPQLSSPPPPSEMDLETISIHSDTTYDDDDDDDDDDDGRDNADDGSDLDIGGELYQYFYSLSDPPIYYLHHLIYHHCVYFIVILNRS